MKLSIIGKNLINEIFLFFFCLKKDYEKQFEKYFSNASSTDENFQV